MSESLNLETWLNQNGIQVQDFAKAVGCSRVTIYKVKRRMPVSPAIAQRIFELTKGQVCPKSQNIVGKRHGFVAF